MQLYASPQNFCVYDSVAKACMSDCVEFNVPLDT